MSQLYHNGCGGLVFAAVSLKLQIVTFALDGGTLIPGATIARLPGEKRAQPKKVAFYCARCDKEVNVLEETHIQCPVCPETHPLKESVMSAFTSFVGEKCFEEYIKKLGYSGGTGALKRYTLVELFGASTITF